MAGQAERVYRENQLLRENRSLLKKLRAMEERIVALETSFKQQSAELTVSRAAARELEGKLKQAVAQGEARDRLPVMNRPDGMIAYQDTERYKGGFGVPSESSPGVIYKISFDTAQGFWVCSCPGGINRGDCKHLKRFNRPGRSAGPQPIPQFVAAPADAVPMPPLPAAMRKIERRFAKDGEPV